MAVQKRHKNKSDCLEAKTTQIVRCQKCGTLCQAEVNSEEFIKTLMQIADETGGIQGLNCQLQGFRFVCPGCGWSEYIELPTTRGPKQSE